MLLGTQQVSVGLRLYLKDEFSKPAANIKANLKALRDETKLYQDSLRSARNALGGIAAAGGAAIYGLASAYQKGAKFDFMMKGVAAASGATADEFKKMMDYANQMGSSSLYLPQQYAETMRELALAGLDAREVMASINPVTKLAGGAMEDLKVSAEIATNAMYQFGYDKSKLDNWKYVSDILAQGAVKSQISLRDLGESIKYAGATSVDLGQTLPDVTAMVMTLGNAGIKGSMAGTAIENMFRYMSLGLGQYAKTGRAAVWEKIGLDPKRMVTVEGNLRPFPDIMRELYNALEKFGDVDRQNILYEIFNVRGKRGASKLLMDGMKEYTKHINELKNSKGVADQMYNKMLESPEGAIIRLKGAFQGLMNTFTQVMAPIVVPLMKGITWVLQGFKKIMEIPIAKWLIIAAVGALTLGTALAAIGFAITGLSLGLMLSTTSFGTLASAIKMATINLLEFIGASRLAGAVAGSTLTGAGAAVATATAVGRTAGGTFFATTAKGNRFISNAAAAQLGVAGMAKGTPASPLPKGPGLFGGIGKGMGGFAGKAFGGLGVLTGAYQAYNSTSTMSTIGGVGNMIGGGMMFVPGLQPLGAGIMAVSTLLSILSGVIEDNTSAVKEASQDEKDAADRMVAAFTANWMDSSNAGHSTYIRRLYEYPGGESNGPDYFLVQQLRSYLENSKSWGGKPYYDYSMPGELNIYINGQLDKHIIRQEMNRQINQTITFQ